MITRPFSLKEQSFWIGGSPSKSGKHFVFTNLLRKKFNNLSYIIIVNRRHLLLPNFLPRL
jgi:hypothetical protein